MARWWETLHLRYNHRTRRLMKYDDHNLHGIAHVKDMMSAGVAGAVQRFPKEHAP